MTPQEAVAYIENYTWSASRLGLERTRELLHALGDPQKQLKFIHVAGSNGKGSTCAMLESILRCAGYRTGLYISPYIQQFCERIQIGGHNIPGERLAAITEQVQTIADHMADHPSQFELVTAIAMVYFQQEHCDIVVLEVGMGGALDSTNVIDAPEVAVITNIGLEHTEYLGSTLAEIAATKAGIIKPGCCTVCYDGAPEVTQVIAQVCREKGVPMHLAKWGTVKPLDHGLLVSDLPGGSRSICCLCWVSTSCVTPPWCWKPYWHCSDAAGIFQKGRSGKGLPVWNGQPVLRCWDSPLYSFWTVATILSALRLWRSCCRTTFLDRRSPC